MSAIVNSLQSFIDSIAIDLPKESSAELKLIEDRINVNPLQPTVVIVDVSGSMASQLESGQSKISFLVSTLKKILEGNEIILAFSSDTSLVDIKNLDALEASGNTDLELAIIHAANYKPKSTLVISDGLPDDKDKALQAAKMLTGVINTLYIGIDSNKEAISFMKDLARFGCGTMSVCNICVLEERNKLASKIYISLPPT
jgi:hypothetical protein